MEKKLNYSQVLARQMYMWLIEADPLNPIRDIGPIDGIWGPKSQAAWDDIKRIWRDPRDSSVEARFKDVFPAVCGPNHNYDYHRHLISYAGFALIHSFEVGTPADYVRRFLHPCWPGGESGITIGIGYDIGYESVEPLERYLDPVIYRKLKKLHGIKGVWAKKHMSRVADITIDYETAIRIFANVTIPKWYRLTSSIFKMNKLPLDCQSALLSLCYNRGTSLEGERRAEMRKIAEILANDGDQVQIPTLLRKMKRLWEGKGLDGLIKRREAEAKLFECGLGIY